MFYPKNSHDSHSPESTGSVSLIIAELAESSSYVTKQHMSGAQAGEVEHVHVIEAVCKYATFCIMKTSYKRSSRMKSLWFHRLFDNSEITWLAETASNLN